MTNTNQNKVPIFGISRLRMGTDGKGVTTLVTFMGCPLRCKYCLNAKCQQPVYEADGKTLCEGIKLLSPQELYDIVKLDNIYFQATGGGICFGGGEPTLYTSFIKEFKSICGDRWKITMESSLYCSPNTIRLLSDVVDHWIVDVKSLNSDIYQAYTEQPSFILSRLQTLREYIPSERITVRVPLIPKYNTEVDVEKDIASLQGLGFENIDKFEYITHRL